jgi:hypothetical protein
MHRDHRPGPIIADGSDHHRRPPGGKLLCHDRDIGGREPAGTKDRHPGSTRAQLVETRPVSGKVGESAGAHSHLIAEIDYEGGPAGGAQGDRGDDR